MCMNEGLKSAYFIERKSQQPKHKPQLSSIHNTGLYVYIQSEEDFHQYKKP